MICFKCGKDTGLVENVTRHSHCPHCNSDARVCKNCGFYDVNSYNDCREPQAERVTEKDKSTFCDYFTPSKKGLPGTKVVDHLAAAKALFKKK